SNTSGAIRAGSTPAQGTEQGIFLGRFPVLFFIIFINRSLLAILTKKSYFCDSDENRYSK
ncbi:MAG: hypothetical protein K2H76_02015, partial [Muribaculaceae bacterium]|nr:hypothetical protein [Muribaculaceae bacterium]